MIIENFIYNIRTLAWPLPSIKVSKCEVTCGLCGFNGSSSITENILRVFVRLKRIRVGLKVESFTQFRPPVFTFTNTLPGTASIGVTALNRGALGKVTKDC